MDEIMNVNIGAFNIRFYTFDFDLSEKVSSPGVNIYPDLLLLYTRPTLSNRTHKAKATISSFPSTDVRKSNGWALNWIFDDEKRVLLG